MGGFGSAVLEALAEEGVTHLPTKVLGLPDWYIEQGPQDLLREKYGLTAEGIYQAVKALSAQTVSAEVSGREPYESSTRLRAHQGHGFTAWGRGTGEHDGDEQGS